MVPILNYLEINYMHRLMIPLFKMNWDNLWNLIAGLQEILTMN